MLPIIATKGEDLGHYGLDSAKHLNTFFTLNISLGSSQSDKLRKNTLNSKGSFPCADKIEASAYPDPLLTPSIAGCDAQLPTQICCQQSPRAQKFRSTSWGNSFTTICFSPRSRSWADLHKFTFQQTFWRLEHFIRFHWICVIDRK